MRKYKHSTMGIISAFMMFCLILDSKTVFLGASEGIELCIKTVIPSLFPFFFLSNILNTFLAQKSFKLLRPLGKLCGMPVNSEHLLLIGFTGGYPVGAQCISNSYKNGILTKEDAERMLGFCNNAGPAFIFGMLSQMFPSLLSIWVLWLIQIFCVLITGFMLPGKSTAHCSIPNQSTLTAQYSLQNAIKAMSTVCGWVILFRVIIVILNRWVLWLIPAKFAVIFSGVLELSNGCIALNTIDDIYLRYIVASFMLSFGGFCVGMQTVSVCQNICSKTYFVGKTLQSLLSVPMTMIVGAILFPGNTLSAVHGVVILVIILFGWVLLKNFKNYTGKLAFYHV